MKSYDYPVQVVHFGNYLTLVGLEGKVVVDYSLRLKQEINDPAVWIVGYSNNYCSYFPAVEFYWKEETLTEEGTLAILLLMWRRELSEWYMIYMADFRPEVWMICNKKEEVIPFL